MPDSPRTTEDEVSSLRDTALGGARWIALARLAGEIVTFASAIVLARLLSPAEFGHAAVALALIPLAAIMTFEGCASALVRRPHIDRAARDSAAFLSMSLGLVLTLLTLAVSPLAELAFGDETGSLLRLVSPVFVLAAPGCVPRALIWRDLRFGALSLIEVCGLLTGAVTSVGCAAAGMNSEALVLGGLAMTTVTSGLLCTQAPLGTPRLHRSEARGIAGFGIPAALAGLVHVGFANVDYIILAARSSATATGLYWRAFTLGVSYQEKASGVLARLAYPVYSRADSIADMRHMHRRATRLQATVVLPILAFVAASAPALVPWLFGPRWNGAVEATQILAIAGMIAAVLNAYPQVMLAIGKPKELLRFNVGMLVIYGTLIVFASGSGLTAVAMAAVVGYVAIFIGVYRFLLGPHLGLKMRESLTDFTPAFLGSVAALAVSLPVRRLLHEAGVPLTAELFGVAATIGAVYLVTIRLFFGAAWADLMLLARKFVPKRRRRPLAVPATTATQG